MCQICIPVAVANVWTGRALLFRTLCLSLLGGHIQDFSSRSKALSVSRRHIELRRGLIPLIRKINWDVLALPMQRNVFMGSAVSGMSSPVSKWSLKARCTRPQCFQSLLRATRCGMLSKFNCTLIVIRVCSHRGTAP